MGIYIYTHCKPSKGEPPRGDSPSRSDRNFHRFDDAALVWSCLRICPCFGARGGNTMLNWGGFGSHRRLVVVGLICFFFWWWQLKYFLIITAILGGNDPIWRAYSSNGLKPPASFFFFLGGCSETFGVFRLHGELDQLFSGSQLAGSNSKFVPTLRHHIYDRHV